MDISDNEYNSSDEGKSVFHGGMTKILRLDQLWRLCQAYSRLGDYNGWKRELDSIYRELSADLTVKETKEHDELVTTKVVPSLKQYAYDKKSGRYGTQIMDSQDGAYTYLAEYEIFLRRVHNRMGLDMPKRGRFDETLGV